MTVPAMTQSETEQLERLTSLVADILAEAKQQGASAAEAGLSVDRGLSVNVRLGEVETIEYHRSQGLGVTVYFGQSKGTASSSDLSTQAVRETVAAACRIAKYAAEDEYAGLPDAELLATEFPDLDLYHPWDLVVDDAIQLAKRCEDAARGYHPDISNSEGANLNTYQGLRVAGNSLGFLHGYPSSRHSMSCSVIGGAGDNMQRDDWWTVARDAADLEPAESVGRKAAERTIRRLGGQSLSTRHCPVIFAAEVAGGLIGHFIGAIRGGNLYRKSSFLLDQLGKPVFPGFIHLHEQPHLRKALQEEGAKLDGIYAGNPKRATARPTTEMMLIAFRGLNLTVINVNEVDRYCMTALNAVQARILGLIGFPREIYQGIGMQSGKPAVKMGEP